MLRGLTALGQTSTELGLPGFYVRLAELYIRAGQPAQAAEALQKAVGLEGFGTRAFDAEVERVRGDISASLAQPDLSAAELAYRSSSGDCTPPTGQPVFIQGGFEFGPAATACRPSP